MVVGRTTMNERSAPELVIDVVAGDATSVGQSPAYAGRGSERAPAEGTFAEHDALAMVVASFGSFAGDREASGAGAASSGAAASALGLLAPGLVDEAGGVCSVDAGSFDAGAASPA